MSFAGQALVLCKALVGSSSQSRWRVLLFGSSLTRSGGMAGLALGQIDSKRCAAALTGGHRNVAVMVADHRLHDGQPQPRTLQLRRVIRREQARALFRRQTLSRIGHFDANLA